MKCASCNAELSPGEMFCGECGQHVRAIDASPSPVTPAGIRACPRCGDHVATGKRFCGSCGHDLMAAPPQAQATHPPRPETQQADAGTPPSSSRVALIVGAVAVAATLLLGSVGVGLWLLFGRGNKEANQNTVPSAGATATPVNANTQRMNVSIAGAWNCELTSDKTAQARMVLAQNGSVITGTLGDEHDTVQLAGTFDGQNFSFKFSDFAEGQLALSPDGSTMKGEAQSEEGRGTVLCSR